MAEQEKTKPDPDKEIAAKGGVIAAPIPAEDRPNREKDVAKAQAMCEGKDPEFVEFVDELEAGDKMVEVAKDGDTLKVAPAAMADHLRLGWRIVDADKADAAKADDKPKGK